MVKSAAGKVAAAGANKAIDAAANGAKGLVKKHLGRRASIMGMVKSAAGKVAAAGANKAIDMATAGAKGLVKKHLGRRDSLLSAAKSALERSLPLVLTRPSIWLPPVLRD